MSVEEQAALIESISTLNQKQTEGILDIVKEFAHSNESMEVSFELAQLPVEKCRALQNYVKNCIKENERKRKRKEQDKIRRQQKREAK